MSAPAFTWPQHSPGVGKTLEEMTATERVATLEYLVGRENIQNNRVARTTLQRMLAAARELLPYEAEGAQP